MPAIEERLVLVEEKVTLAEQRLVSLRRMIIDLERQFRDWKIELEKQAAIAAQQEEDQKHSRNIRRRYG